MMRLEDLSNRVLQKLGVLGVGETASAEDRAKALEGLRSAHQTVKVRRLARWTENSIPESCEEPYVLLAATLIAPDFGREASPLWWAHAMGEISAAASVGPSQGPIPAEYF